MTGLTEQQVVEKRKKYGNNKIITKQKETFFSLFIESLGDPIIKILLIALAMKTLLLFKNFDWYETIGIMSAILIASLISTISEYGSNKTFEKMMKDASNIKCKVKRDGKKQEIYLHELVVGDTVYLTTGDKVGADGTIIKGIIDVDESMFSGETTPISKKINDTIYRGSVVFNGNCIIKINKVGNNTYYGQMVEELSQGSGTSPLKERLNKLALTISKVGYIAAFLVSISYLFSKIIIENNFQLEKILLTLSDSSLLLAYFLHALTLSVTVIVVSVPEGLPLLVNLVLSSNMKRMLKNNVLVRKLIGIETAGSLNILFTDKTGTLTKGNLEVTEFMLGNGKIYQHPTQTSKRYQKIFIDSLIYNNESTYDKENNQIIGGNLTDKAILNYIKINKNENTEITKQIFFDSKNKYSLTEIKEHGKKITYIKGASEVLLKNCNRYLNEDGFKQLITKKDYLEQKIKEITKKGIRIICVAYKEGEEQNLKDLILLGFIFIKDEIREESIEGIKNIQSAGIQTVMITGDHKETAINIAKEVGIIQKDTDIILESDQLQKMTDEEVLKILPKLKVISRALPTDKSRLVELAQKNNLVVGMTGDGVNDAIALKKADVGFSMGSGTEVAKEASDIVILDDNILSIQKAILYGRTIFKSIRKFIIFQLTINICAVIISIAGPFIGIQTPVTVIQMLWINMIMDTLAGLAFSYEPPLKEYMKEPPKKRQEPILNSYMKNEIIITGLYTSTLCIFFLTNPSIKNLFRYSPDNCYILTAFFGLFIFLSIFNIFNARTIRLNILKNIFQNKIFIGITIFITIIQIIMIYYGGTIFRTSGLTVKEFIIMITIAFSVIPFDILRKIILNKINYPSNI